MRENRFESKLMKMYASMLMIRKCEERIGDLVASGKIKTPCHLYIGQEAIAVGVCAALKKEDVVFSSHRSHGHYIAKGGNINKLMAELYGKITGCSKGKGGSMHLACMDIGLIGSSAMVAGGIPLATGAALAFSLKRKSNVAVAFFGDGATNEGVFYESLNFASLKKLPVIFICENNLYSTHMPIAATLADTRIYKKAEIFNMTGIQIDGNNVIEVFDKINDVVKSARSGKGPALIECLTYRWRGHVGPNLDLDKGLRSKEELESWMGKCPIKRLERVLKLSKREKEEASRGIEQKIEQAVSFAEKSRYPKKEKVFSDIFK